MVKNYLLFSFLVFSFFCSTGQSTGGSFDFDDSDISGWGSSTTLLTESSFSGGVLIKSDGVGNSNLKNSFFYYGETFDLSSNASVSFRVKSKQELSLRIDLIDEDGKATSFSPAIREIRNLGVWNTITIDFDNLFRTGSPTFSSVDRTKISGMLIYINPDSELFKGDVLIDDIKIGDQAVASIGNGTPGIKLNQLGFYPESEKIAIVSSSNETDFTVLNSEGIEVFTGPLGDLQYWDLADDCVRVADFSDLKTKGKYSVNVDNVPSSFQFEIKDQPYLEASKGAIKAYYYNRASTELTSEYAGVYSRASGHLDNTVLVHSSASDENRPTGTVISAPKGWYDAGDYNKYIVNSGISTYTLMSLYEHFSSVYDTLNLNIPESTNDLPDLLDEVKWNLDWMLAMQDPNDGGVYFKLTSQNFTGSILPSADNTTRYVVQKSTSSALNFAAVMAVAYRVYKPFEDELPGYGDTCLARSKRAYEWAQLNPNVTFTNPSDINTGGYGDRNFTDEFSWAATELYIALNNDDYYSSIVFPSRNDIPTWNQVGGLGFVSLSHHLSNLTDVADEDAIKDELHAYVSFYIDEFEDTPYRIPMGANGSWEFNWGSNSRAANISMLMLQDYYNTGNEKSFVGAKANLDYLLGRNPLDFSFMTGFGSKTPQDPHHRPSEADGVSAPQPGFLVGGPNDNSSGESACVYPSFLPAREYVDAQCSFSTNEIAINWNAPLAFVLGAVNAESVGVSPKTLDFRNPDLVGVKKTLENNTLTVFPNPATHTCSFSVPEGVYVVSSSLMSMNGTEIIKGSEDNKFDVSELKGGVYFINVISSNGVLTKKVNVGR